MRANLDFTEHVYADAGSVRAITCERQNSLDSYHGAGNCPHGDQHM